MKEYLKTIGLFLLHFVILIGVLLLFNFLVGNLVTAYPGTKAFIWVYPVVTSTVSFLVVSLIFFLIMKIRKKKLLEVYAINKVDPINAVIFVVLGMMTSLFSLAFPNLDIGKGYFDSIELYMYYLNDQGLWIIVLALVSVTSLFEEIVLRGTIFNELRRKIPVTVSIVLTGLVYATVAQPNVVWMIFFFLAAIVCTCSYQWGGGITASAIVQLSSGASLLLFRRLGMHQLLSKANDAILILVILASVAVILGGLFLVRGKHKKMTAAIPGIRAA